MRIAGWACRNRPPESGSGARSRGATEQILSKACKPAPDTCAILDRRSSRFLIDRLRREAAHDTRSAGRKSEAPWGGTGRPCRDRVGGKIMSQNDRLRAALAQIDEL